MLIYIDGEFRERNAAKVSVFDHGLLYGDGVFEGIRIYPAELYEAGVKVLTSATRQVSHEAMDPRVKSLNYLKNVLAKIDAQRAGAHEAIMLNAEGFIAECTADNLFLVRRGALLTPAPQDGALEGITWGAVIELARAEAIPTAEARLTRFDLYTADEAFMTGTGAEVVPIAEADGRPIGTGSRPVTLRLRKGFQELARIEGEPVF